MTSAEQRLKELGITLPPPPEAFGTYAEAVQTGALLFMTGMLPTEGRRAIFVGRVGAEIDVAAGRKAARLAALNALAVARQYLGSLDRVTRVVRLGVFVATAGDVRDQPKVADGASELLQEIFGKEKNPARMVYGVASLPLGASVELEIILEVADGVDPPTSYRTTQIDGLSVFYREAGPKGAPTILLLHGLPSSSRMFEPLFARLSDRYHLVAPDYPGFGHSDWPHPKTFAYTFDHYAEIMIISPKRSGSRATRCTCRITAAPWAFAWPWLIRIGSRRSLSRMRWHTTKAWGRTGSRGEPFGPIAPPTKARCARISSRWRPRGHGTSGTIPT